MFILLQSKGTFLHRTASFDVLSAKIGLTDSPVGELKNQKSVVNFEQEVCIFYLYGEQKPLDRLKSPNFFGGRGPRLNHAIQIWWRSVQGFLVGWGSKFAFFHRLWRSSLQHSHYRVRCDYCYCCCSLAWWRRNQSGHLTRSTQPDHASVSRHNECQQRRKLGRK